MLTLRRGPKYVYRGKTSRWLSFANPKPSIVNMKPLQELKTEFQTFTGDVDNNFTAPFLSSFCVSNVAQGSAINERIGNAITLKKLFVKSCIKLSNTVTRAVNGKIFILQYQSPNGADPSSFNFMIQFMDNQYTAGGDPIYNNPRNVNYLKSVKVLKTVPFRLETASNASLGQNMEANVNIEFSVIPPTKVQVFQGTGGGFIDVSNGGLYLVIFADEPAGAIANCTHQTITQLFYTDS